MLILHYLKFLTLKITHEKINIFVAVASLSFLNAKRPKFKRKTLRSPGTDAVICLTAPVPCDILQLKKLLLKGRLSTSNFVLLCFCFYLIKKLKIKKF